MRRRGRLRAGVVHHSASRYTASCHTQGKQHSHHPAELAHCGRQIHHVYSPERKLKSWNDHVSVRSPTRTRPSECRKPRAINHFCRFFKRLSSHLPHTTSPISLHRKVLLLRGNTAHRDLPLSLSCPQQQVPVMNEFLADPRLCWRLPTQADFSNYKAFTP